MCNSTGLISALKNLASFPVSGEVKGGVQIHFEVADTPVVVEGDSYYKVTYIKTETPDGELAEATEEVEDLI
jgi:hypothetical protein